jgi:hypothetical protein
MSDKLFNNFQLPKAKEFLDHERKVLKQMLRITEIQSSILYKSISQALSLLESSNKGYKFHCIIPIENDPNFEKGDAEIAIGAYVSINKKKRQYEQICYSVSIIIKNRGLDGKYCKKKCFQSEDGSYRSRIIRRFHFDFDTFNKEDHPMFHLQYGGNPEDELEEYHYCLEPWLETPRIFFPPVNLALVFEIALREFNTEIQNSFLEKGEWKKILRDSENLLLEPYIKECYNYFSRSGTRDVSPTFIHWHYGTK